MLRNDSIVDPIRGLSEKGIKLYEEAYIIYANKKPYNKKRDGAVGYIWKLHDFLVLNDDKFIEIGDLVGGMAKFTPYKGLMGGDGVRIITGVNLICMPKDPKYLYTNRDGNFCYDDNPYITTLISDDYKIQIKVEEYTNKKGAVRGHKKWIKDTKSNNLPKKISKNFLILKKLKVLE